MEGNLSVFGPCYRLEALAVAYPAGLTTVDSSAEWKVGIGAAPARWRTRTQIGAGENVQTAAITFRTASVRLILASRSAPTHSKASCSLKTTFPTARTRKLNCRVARPDLLT